MGREECATCRTSVEEEGRIADGKRGVGTWEGREERDVEREERVVATEADGLHSWSATGAETLKAAFLPRLPSLGKARLAHAGDSKTCRETLATVRLGS